MNRGEGFKSPLPLSSYPRRSGPDPVRAGAVVCRTPAGRPSAAPLEPGDSSACRGSTCSANRRRLRHPSSTGIPPVGGMQHIRVVPRPRTLLGRENPAHALRAQLLHRRGRRPHRRAGPGRLPGRVGARLVQEVPSVERPRAARVLGHVQQRGPRGRHPRPALGAVLGEPFLVIRLQLRRVRAGAERQPEPGGPGGCGADGSRWSVRSPDRRRRAARTVSCGPPSARPGSPWLILGLLWTSSSLL